jgi:molecular chaperone DnaJ
VHTEPVPTLNDKLRDARDELQGTLEAALGAAGERLGRLYRRVARGRFEAGRDEELLLPVDLHALAFGKTLKVAISRLVPCPRCQREEGRGEEARSEGAEGEDVPREEGVVIRDEKISALTRAEGCEVCLGEARVSRREELSVSVPPGADEGRKLRLAGRGRAGLNGHPDGDLYLLLSPPELPKGFKRSGADLTLELGVPAEVMRAGGAVSAQTPHGAINITVPPGSTSGRQLRAAGQGLARWGRPEERGDLLITLRAR